MTRREFLASVNAHIADALREKSGGGLDDAMTMADYGIAHMAFSDFGHDHRSELPRPSEEHDTPA